MGSGNGVRLDHLDKRILEMVARRVWDADAASFACRSVTALNNLTDRLRGINEVEKKYRMNATRNRDNE